MLAALSLLAAGICLIGGVLLVVFIIAVAVCYEH